MAQATPPTVVYLVIGHMGHAFSDVLSVHRTQEGAERALASVRAPWPKGYTWYEVDDMDLQD